MAKTVLVFGTFDRLDAEHRVFLAEAKKHGDRLVVGVARDAHVRTLKQKEPVETETVRLEHARNESVVDDAVLCDEELGSFAMIPEIRPDIIVLGFDQEALGAELARWMVGKGITIPIKRLPKFAPPLSEPHE